MAREMKDSGIEWVKRIPKEWQISSNSHLFSFEKKIVGNEWTKTQLLSLTKKGIVTKNINDGGGKQPESFSTYQQVHKKQLVMCLFDLDVSAVFSGVSNYDGMISPAYKVFSINQSLLYPKYIDYYFQAIFINRNYVMYSKSLRKTIDTDNFMSIKTIVPPLSEQQKIADFLDEKVKEIDNAIEKTKETIELYKKYKQAIITEAVTKGLDPNVEMKDSGVEWIGKVPENWKLVKSKYVITITHGSDPMTSGKIPVYGSGGKSFRTCGEFKDGPCVLIGRKGATLYIPHYIIGKYWNIDTAFDVKTLTDDIELKYYYYLATCFDYNLFITNTTLPSMTQADYYSMTIPLPLRKIQKKIIDWLDEKCDYIDKIIEQENSLTLMFENYKKSLIYEYVTGKKEVK